MDRDLVAHVTRLASGRAQGAMTEDLWKTERMF
jgi:hypothetical protein